MIRKEGWMTDRWFVSPYNLLEEVTEKSLAPSKVEMYDVTLRDGEQTPGVVLRKNEKIEIARALDELGVKKIEAGMPATSSEDKEAVKEIAHLGLSAEIWGFSRCLRRDVDINLDCDVSAIICEISTSDVKMKAYGFSRESVIEKIIDAVSYAKAHGLHVAFFAVDMTRTDLDFLKKAYTVAVQEAGADEAVVVDTIGVALPKVMYYLTRKVKEWVNVPVHIHCHNDFGLATACTIAGVQGGARCVHSTINGIGEKAGNCDTAEIALSLELLCGVETGLKLEKLREVSKLVERLSAFKIASNKPVVGENVFKRESGLAVQQLITHPPAVESFSPELVGGKREIVIGKKSGRHAIEWKLKEMGLSATGEQVKTILEKVKRESERKKGPLTTSELRAIVKEVKEIN